MGSGQAGSAGGRLAERDVAAAEDGNDAAFARDLTPSLTTIRQPVARVGEKAKKGYCPIAVPTPRGHSFGMSALTTRRAPVRFAFA